MRQRPGVRPYFKRAALHSSKSVNEINVNDISRLGLSWFVDTGPGNAATLPLAVDGVRFYATAYSNPRRRRRDGAARKLLFGTAMSMWGLRDQCHSDCQPRGAG
jgi:hypothetical protein